MHEASTFLRLFLTAKMHDGHTSTQVIIVLTWSLPWSVIIKLTARAHRALHRSDSNGAKHRECQVEDLHPGYQLRRKEVRLPTFWSSSLWNITVRQQIVFKAALKWAGSVFYCAWQVLKHRLSSGSRRGPEDNCNMDGAGQSDINLSGSRGTFPSQDDQLVATMTQRHLNRSTKTYTLIVLRFT